MKKLAATIFIATFVAITAFGQGTPTLRIVTETPGLPSDLFYGTVKVKPLRLRPGTNIPITIADKDFFIQQQYIDFLRRFPEAGPDGQYGTADDPLKFYTDILDGCNPNDIECIKYTRGALSANFFRSPEFRGKGNFVLFMYMVSLGQRAVTPAELGDATKIERPVYTEFLTDLTSVSDPNDDPVIVEQKKVAFANAWMTRPEIVAKYPGSMTGPQFVQALFNTAGLTISGQTWGADIDAGTKTRAQVVRLFAERQETFDKFFKAAFVTMEYFGYLRRNPEDCHNSANWSDGTASSCGYIFHNNRFNTPGADPDLIQNIIVRGFIEAPEYINRF